MTLMDVHVVPLLREKTLHRKSDRSSESLKNEMLPRQ